MSTYPEISVVTIRIGSRILRVFPFVLSCKRKRAHRPYELTPTLLSSAEHNNQSTSAWGRLSSVFFSSVEPLIQVHFAVTCVKPLNTIFSDCVMLVISRRVWAYTPATSSYTRHWPQTRCQWVLCCGSFVSARRQNRMKYEFLQCASLPAPLSLKKRRSWRQGTRMIPFDCDIYIKQQVSAFFFLPSDNPYFLLMGCFKRNSYMLIHVERTTTP